jgi:release factor glutamine methyltransferase
MKNSKDLFRDLRKQITLSEDAAEIESMLYLVLEHVAGITRSNVISQKEISLTEKEEQRFEEVIKRLNTQEPVQYILGKADFFGRVFGVNPSVLIPRPETELLIEAVKKQISNVPGKILDIGTGSGCIAITLAKELPSKTLFAFDISEAALKTASENATDLSAHVDFRKTDILKGNIPFSDLEVIVSNPPYVTFSEKLSMNDNVLKHEPHLALFVPDDDPLVFYKAIAKKGFKALMPGGKIFVEINEQFGKETEDVFRMEGFTMIRSIKDLQGKDRVVVATKPVQ